MRTIDLSTAFKRDYKRAKANPRHAQDVRALYEGAALLLAEDKPLPETTEIMLWSANGKAIESAT
jgi:mRNA-degrading endonuclease YafQ of YafQ-DinJ toxin-antitoxin module